MRTDGYPGSLPLGTDVTAMLAASGYLMPTSRKPLSILPISPTFRAFLALFTRSRHLDGNPRSLAAVDTMAIRRVTTADGRLLGWLTSPARISDALPSVGSTADDDLGASLELLQGSRSTPVARIEGQGRRLARTRRCTAGRSSTPTASTGRSRSGRTRPAWSSRRPSTWPSGAPACCSR